MNTSGWNYTDREGNAIELHHLVREKSKTSVQDVGPRRRSNAMSADFRAIAASDGEASTVVLCRLGRSSSRIELWLSMVRQMLSHTESCESWRL
jgi:hypothetical protein